MSSVGKAGQRPLLSVSSLSKSFGKVEALADVDLTVQPGEFVALLGPSGCGKTSLLRCIAGFVDPDRGAIVLDGEDITRRPPNQRPLNTVFQNYALFPHMTVAENVAYGPRRRGVPRGEIHGAVQAALALVELTGFESRMPRELSGGQQQRVALARAIVNKPRLLLLDEPLAALDLKLRRQMQLELKHLQAKLGIAFVFVTHDQEEAMTMADQIVVMNRGRIEQSGSAAEIYTRPNTIFVADFIGEANLLPMRLDDGQLRACIGGVSVPHPGGSATAFTAVLRPENIAIVDPSSADAVSARVTEVVDIGGHLLIHADIGGRSIRLRRLGSERGRLAAGSEIGLTWHPEHLHVVAGAVP